jgi:hypothetical protein
VNHTPHQVAVLESEHGRIELARTRPGIGYRLTDDAEGFGAGLVENELTPRLGRRGSMLGPQREAAGTMMLPIVLSGRSRAEIRDMVAELTRVLKLAQGTARLSLVDQETGEGRYRDIAYTSGLETPAWSSPTTVKYIVDVDYMDPWAYSTELGEVTIPVAREASGGLQAPVRVPVRVARSGGAVDRWGTNQGENPAPVTLRFNGPVTDPVVELQGHWTFRVRGSLAWDEYLVIDPDLTNPTATIYSTTSNASRSAFTMIATSSRLTDLVLPPGQHSFTFRAIDPTFMASMTASWPNTYASMQ